MTNDRAGRFVALLAAVMTPAAAVGGNVRADHCGSITSGDGQYRASFTRVRNADPRSRIIRIFLCDRSYNCDTVFEAPHDAEVSMRWRSGGELAVIADKGAPVPPGTIDSIARGRPPVRIVTPPPETGPTAGASLDFKPEQCRVEPPIASRQSTGSFQDR